MIARFCSSRRGLMPSVAFGMSMGPKQNFQPWAPLVRPSVVAMVFFTLLSIPLNFCAATTHPDDIEALKQIKAAVDVSTIPSFSCLGSWNFSADPCDRSSLGDSFVCGLDCDVGLNATRRIISLMLDSPGYRGTLSPFVGNLSALQFLHVSNNKFFGEIPETMGQLMDLVELDLSGNLFSGNLPGSLGLLSNLQSLVVSNNVFEGAIPRSLSGMTNLVRISLFKNKLSYSIPPLYRLSKLAYFDASGNNLSGPLPSEFPSSLGLLSLRNNSLTGTLPGSLFVQLNRLNVLDVSLNQLSGNVDSAIFNLPTLEQANFSSNRFSGFTGTNVSGLNSQIVALDLSFNELSGLLPSFVADMPNLSSLSLSHNNFRGEIPYEYGLKCAGQIASSLKLGRLWLDGNYLSGSIPGPFLNISSDSLVGSFIDNCLQDCPSSLSLCQGGHQKSRSVCENAYSKLSPENGLIREGN